MPSPRIKVNESPKKSKRTTAIDIESSKSKKRKILLEDKEDSCDPELTKSIEIKEEKPDSLGTLSADSSEIEEVEVTKDNEDHNYSAIKILDSFSVMEDGYEPLPTIEDIKPKVPTRRPRIPLPNLLKRQPKVVVERINPNLINNQTHQIQQHDQLHKQILQQKQIETQLQQQLDQKRKEIQLQKQKSQQLEKFTLQKNKLVLVSTVQQKQQNMQEHEKLQQLIKKNDFVLVNTDKGAMLVPKIALKTNTQNPIGTMSKVLLHPQISNSKPKTVNKTRPVIDLTESSSKTSIGTPKAALIPPLVNIQQKQVVKATPPVIDLTERNVNTYTRTPKPASMSQIGPAAKIPTVIDLSTDDSKEAEQAVPKNLKIDFVNGTIVVDSEAFKIECFDTECPDGKVRVTVAASGNHPKRTIVLKKLPLQLSMLLSERWKTSRSVPTTPENNTAAPLPSVSKEKSAKKQVTIFPAAPKVHNKIEYERHVPETVVDGSEVNCIVVGGKKYQYLPSLTPTTNKLQKPPPPVQKEKPPEINKDLINTQLVLDELSKALDSNDKDSDTSSISLQSAKKVYGQKSKFGIRWSEEDKLTALSLYKYSAKKYRSFQTVFSLPSKKLLTLIFRNVKFNEGINQKLFSILKFSLKHFCEKDKICSLAFDVVIQSAPNKVTEYALTFVLNGLNRPWEQPVANYVDIKRFEPKLISDYAKEIISAVESIGISVICTVCNIRLFSVLKFLGSTVNNPSFVLNGKTRYTLLDFKDLLVSIRNELFNHDLKMGPDIIKDVACWQHIKEVVLFDNINTYKHLQGVDDSCLESLDKNSKNKFIKSRKILSYKIGSSLNSFTVSGNLECSGINTANFVIKINELFDSFLGNSDVPHGLKGLNCVLKKTREDLHLDFWSLSIREIREWKFLKDHKVYNSRVLSSLLIVLKVLPLLWESLKNSGFESFNLNKLSTKSLNDFVQRARARNAKLKREMSLFSILTLELKHKTESNVVDMMVKEDDQTSPNEQMFKILTQFISSPSFYQNIVDFGPIAGAEDSSDSSDSDG